MPFTGSHPAAVLPFKRWCSQTPYFAALVMGSMSPDFGYFSPIDINTRYSHTFEGALVMDLPISALALVILLLVRRSFCQLFPNPHRDFLLSLCVKPRFSWKMLFITLLCLWFGALTHVIWDGFTHALSPLVKRSEWLRQEVGLGFPLYRVIQHLSTLIGGFILLLAYRKALRKKGNLSWFQGEAKEIKRYLIWILSGLLSLGVSFLKNWRERSPLQSSQDYQFFAFHWVVDSLAFYFALIILFWLIWQGFKPFRLALNR